MEDKLFEELKETSRFIYRLLDDNPTFEDIDIDEVRDFTHRLGDMLINALISQAPEAEDSQPDKKQDKTLVPDPILRSFKAKWLQKHIIGQDRATEEIARSVRIGAKRATPTSQRTLITKLIFAGPTGVGKTETAKTLGNLLKHVGYQFIRIDLNLYRTPESAWSLIGSPKGYVGSETGGILTRAIKKNPRVVLLFDELEKADPLLHTTFMTLVDEGYIEEQSTGKKVFLDRAIIIFTTNYMAEEFALMSSDEEFDLKAREIMEGYFGMPELIGRIDRIIPFRRLDEIDLSRIAQKVLAPYGKEAYAYPLTRKYMSVANR